MHILMDDGRLVHAKMGPGGRWIPDEGEVMEDNTQKRATELHHRTTPERMALYMEIERERVYQDQKWGGPEHDDAHGVRDWVSFIVAYLGKAVGRKARWGEKLSFSRIALVKVAALCVAALEAFDRKIASQGL